MRESLVDGWSLDPSDATLRSYLRSVNDNDDGVSGCFPMHLGTAGGSPQERTLASRAPNSFSRDDFGSTQAVRLGEPNQGGWPAAKSAFERLEVGCKVVPVMGRYTEAIVKVGFGLVGLVQAMGREGEPIERLERNTCKLAMLLEDLGKRHDNRIMAARVTEIQAELQNVLGTINDLAILRFGVSSRDDRIMRVVRKVLDAIRPLVNLKTASLVEELENPELEQQRRYLSNLLGDGKYGAQGNAIEDVVCWPGTRVKTLERIDRWIRDMSSPHRVFYIRGMAGRGKSAIAATVAHNWEHQASCAVFHFRRQNNLNKRVICALARQLGRSLVPEVKRAVFDSLQQNQDIADQRLDMQFKTLLVAPLEKLKHENHIILIVVDGLDECDCVEDAVDFVRLIDQHSSSLRPHVKFLLTCRPEAPLLRALEPKGWQSEDLDLLFDVRKDLSLFIQQACIRIRRDHGLQEDWPSSRDVITLAEMSQGLFQWARTAITYIGGGYPKTRLQVVLKRPWEWGGLDRLYDQILSTAFNSVGLEGRQELLRSVLGTIVAAPHTVSLEVIAGLYGNNVTFEGLDQNDIIQALRHDVMVHLSSLLLIPASSTEPLDLVHTSVRDLLTDKRRSEGRPYYINLTHHHERLANLCLAIMVRCLKENICNLSDLSKPNSENQDLINREIPSAVRYCCGAWSIHLTRGVVWSGPGTGGPGGWLSDFNTFSKAKLMHWLEVMSLVGATTEAILAAKRVHEWLLKCPTEIPESKLLSDLWGDVKRFIAAFSEPISFGALHIYASALPHCPQKTRLWDWYGRHAKIRTVRGIQPLTWPPNVWTRSTGAPVWTIAISPDGATLAAGLKDGMVQLFDAQTSAPRGEPLTGHNDIVQSVVFSPKDNVLASGSLDRTVRLWDAQTRAPLGDAFTGHHAGVHSVAFSPDGNVLASGSYDHTIRLWDIQTRAALGGPLIGHEDLVHSVAFSPDGKVLASGSLDCTIILWDVRNRRPLGEPLKDHEDGIFSVAFSPDGKILASGSLDRTIRLWDVGVEPWKPLAGPLTGHLNGVYSVAFSPDGKVLASGSLDSTIQLWNVQRRTPLGGSLTGHNQPVRSVWFSPDGKFLASGSLDQTIRSWDTEVVPPRHEPRTDHSHSIRSVAISPDGKVLASGSFDRTIQLWDAHTGTPLGRPLTGHKHPVSSVVFSPDSTVLASGSTDRTIRLWCANTGIPLGQPLTGHSGWIRSVWFSPDGKTLASGSSDGAIRLWDVQTGRPLGCPLTDQSGGVYSIAFSPSGRTLASGSLDKTIQFWDAKTGSPLGEVLTGHEDVVRAMAFSPDGKVLASGSRDGIIRLWNAQNGTSLGQPLEDHDGHLSSVAFSPDNKVLASGFEDGTVQLWDVQNATVLDEPLKGHRSLMFFVLLSQANTWAPHTLPHWHRVLSFQDHWVTVCSSRLLWLPAQYWTEESLQIRVSHQSLMIICNQSLSIFDIADTLQ